MADKLRGVPPQEGHLMKRLLSLLLLVALIVPVFAANIPPNESTATYSIETQLSKKPITEESFIYKSESKSDIKEKPFITINITPILSSGKKLDRKIDAKELPVDQLVTNLVEHINNGVKKNKLVQVYPETVLEISDDAETVKQSSSNNGRMRHEIYYGYQKSIAQPWSQYYKVENCGLEFCRVVRADFITKVVTIEKITLEQANGITGIPAWEILP